MRPAALVRASFGSVASNSRDEAANRPTTTKGEARYLSGSRQTLLVMLIPSPCFAGIAFRLDLAAQSPDCAVKVERAGQVFRHHAVEVSAMRSANLAWLLA